MQGVDGPLREGEIVGGAYRIVAPIGRGGMGTVYRAVDVTAQRSVAVKVMLPGAVTQVRLARFEREAELSARLDRNHGIARVYASGLHRGLPFIAMELVEGQDLEALLERGPLAIQHAIEVLAAVAHAVGACHAAGVVHRDLKPGNVLLGEDGPKVIDFGLARDADGAGAGLTREGELVGTPFYMPPEQLAGAVVGARADVYALGAILYHALTGRPPFVGSTLMELAARATTGGLAPPSSLRQGVTADLDAVCLRALAKQPDERYADGTALALDLERLRRHERPTASTQHNGWTTVALILARARAGERRALLLVSVISVTILSLCGTIATLLVQRPKRAAAAVLAQVLEWDGERCERLPAGCREGPHVLARWDLGLGDGQAPTLSEVDDRRATLERSLGHLDGEAALVGKDEAARLLAVRPLLGGEADPRGASATGLLVEALALRANDDVEGAQERVERALTLQPDSAAGVRLRARLRGEGVAARPGRARELASWLRARGRTPRERDLALEAAGAGLPRAYLRLVAGAAGRAEDDGTDLAQELEAFVAAATTLELGDAVRSTIAAAKSEALEGAAADWGRALAGALAEDAAADLRVLHRLGVAARHDPAVTVGPRLVAVLSRAHEQRFPAGSDDAAITRAARFDAALVHRVGLLQPVPTGLGELLFGMLDGGMRVQLRDVDVDVVLTFMRSAVRVRGEKVPVVAARTGLERLEALLRERPRSLALRLCLLASAAGDREEATLSREVVGMTDGLFADAIVDVSPPYLVEAHLQVVRVRWAQLALAVRKGEPTKEAARAMVAAVEAMNEHAGWAKGDALREAYVHGAVAACSLSVDEGLAWREANVATFRTRLERAGVQGSTPEGIRLAWQEELRSLVRILHAGATWLDEIAEHRADRVALRERADAWWREALALCDEFDAVGAELVRVVRATYEARRP